MFWGKQDSRELSFWEILCEGMWCKTFFVPIDATFASGLICILVYRAGLLLLLLTRLYWPDKTWSFKKFEAFAVLPLLVFFMYSSPFSFLAFLFIFPPQSFSGRTASVYSQSYLFSCFVPFVHLQLSVFIMWNKWFGSLKRIVTTQGKI